MSAEKLEAGPGAGDLAKALRELIPVQYLGTPTSALLLDLANRWCERQRAWHGPGHLLSLLRRIHERRWNLGDGDRDVLLLTALYHDAIYDPRAGDNEAASAALLSEHAADPQSPVITRAVELIVASTWKEPPGDSLTAAFFELDTFQLSDQCSLRERLAYERAIFRQFQWTAWPKYRAARAEFLEAWSVRFPQHRRGALECIELLHGLAPRVAIYPGSFNPFHLGHLSILRQAEQAFDKVIVAVGVNRQKGGAVASMQERHTALQAQLRYHEVVAFEGLLSTLLAESELPLTVVRGVRTGTDLEEELRFARFLDELQPGSRVVWIGCEAHLQHLSSSGIRELEAIQPGAGRRYIPSEADIYAPV